MLCKFHGSAAGCRYGNICKFSHSDPQSVPVCQNYFTSYCHYQNKCQFRHNINHSAAVVANTNVFHKNPNWFACYEPSNLWTPDTEYVIIKNNLYAIRHDSFYDLNSIPLKIYKYNSIIDKFILHIDKCYPVRNSTTHTFTDNYCSTIRCVEINNNNIIIFQTINATTTNDYRNISLDQIIQCNMKTHEINPLHPKSLLDKVGIFKRIPHDSDVLMYQNSTTLVEHVLKTTNILFIPKDIKQLITKYYGHYIYFANTTLSGAIHIIDGKYIEWMDTDNIHVENVNNTAYFDSTPRNRCIRNDYCWSSGWSAHSNVKCYLAKLKLDLPIRLQTNNQTMSPLFKFIKYNGYLHLFNGFDHYSKSLGYKSLILKPTSSQSNTTHPIYGIRRSPTIRQRLSRLQGNVSIVCKKPVHIFS